jgi:hypothetical protein
VWVDSVEADDVEQDVWLIVLESPETARGLLEAAPGDAVNLARLLATREASKARDAYDYFSGNFNYTVDEIRALLDKDVLIAPVEGFDSAVIDLIDALQSMVTVPRKGDKPTYLDAILECYADGIVPDRQSAERRRLDRAVEDLTHRMNRIGRRRAQEGGLKAKWRDQVDFE